MRVPDFEFFLPSDDDTPSPPSCVVCDATENLTERVWRGAPVSGTNPDGCYVVHLCPPCLEADDEEDKANVCLDAPTANVLTTDHPADTGKF